MPKIHLLFFDAGGGHRNAATALQASVAEIYPDWETELVNVGKLLEPLDFLHKYAGTSGEEMYNKYLERGFTLGSAGMLRAIQWIVRLNRGRVQRLMAGHWRATRPDLVVSLIPNFNRPLFEALEEACPDSPYMTVMTDIADYPPHFWMEKQAQYVVCGSAKAAAQARALGYEEFQIFQSSGMILQPQFYAPPAVDVFAERTRLGLEPELATALVLFGGHGAAVMKDIHDRLQRSRLPVQGIFLCGKNERLAKELARARGRMPIHVEGFTKEIPYYMKLSDFFIGKPGPGSISEAIQMNLPVIVRRNAWTLPQERYNAEWVAENQVGLVLRNFREVAGSTAYLLESGRLERFRTNARAIENRAVFEAPRWMEKVLQEGPARRRVRRRDGMDSRTPASAL